LLFAPAAGRTATAVAGAIVLVVPLAGQLSGRAGFDVVDTKGHKGDRVLFSKWNSFSRIGVYDRKFGDWSLSPTYTGSLPDSLFMDIDSAASTPILKGTGRAADADYLRYELTALAYQLADANMGYNPDQLRATSEPPDVQVFSDGRILDANELSIKAKPKFNQIGTDQAGNIAVVDPKKNLLFDPETRTPRTDEYSVGLDRDEADLEDPMAATGQPGRLHVDDGEPRHSHAPDHKPGV